MIYQNLSREETARASFVAALARFREEWQDNTDGSLLDVQASVGLLLSDLAAALDLSTEEQARVLGETLIHELEEILQTA